MGLIEGNAQFFINIEDELVILYIGYQMIDIMPLQGKLKQIIQTACVGMFDKFPGNAGSYLGLGIELCCFSQKQKLVEFLLPPFDAERNIKNGIVNNRCNFYLGKLSDKFG